MRRRRIEPPPEVREDYNKRLREEAIAKIDEFIAFGLDLDGVESSMTSIAEMPDKARLTIRFKSNRVKLV
jgi:hypothetical protein